MCLACGATLRIVLAKEEETAEVFSRIPVFGPLSPVQTEDGKDLPLAVAWMELDKKQLGNIAMGPSTRRLHNFFRLKPLIEQCQLRRERDD